MLHLASVRPAALHECLVHARHREVVDELDIAVVTAERVHRLADEIDQFRPARGNRIGELGCEAVPVDRDKRSKDPADDYFLRQL